MLSGDFFLLDVDEAQFEEVYCDQGSVLKNFTDSFLKEKFMDLICPNLFLLKLRKIVTCLRQLSLYFTEKYLMVQQFFIFLMNTYH